MYQAGMTRCGGQVNAVTPRDRIVGAVFVLATVATQVRWMGRATTVLSVGFVIAYLLWLATRWKNDPAAVLPLYLLAIAVQCLHFTEEFLTGFQRQFPMLIGYERRAICDVQYGVACHVCSGWAWRLPAHATSLPRRSVPCAGRGRGQRCRPSTLECDAEKVFPRSGHGSPLPVGGYRVAYEAVRRSKTEARTGINRGWHHAARASWIFPTRSQILVKAPIGDVGTVRKMSCRSGVSRISPSCRIYLSG